MILLAPQNIMLNCTYCCLQTFLIKTTLRKEVDMNDLNKGRKVIKDNKNGFPPNLCKTSCGR